MLLGLAVVALVAGGTRVGHVQAPATFASQIAQLSEPGGFFDTDNLISNEKSYLHVTPALRESGLSGGAYIGVGPDQNFSYIAQLKPSVAFIVDIRLDNLLLHLLFKALFQLADTRVGYLSLLFGRPVPGDLAEWRRADLEKIVAYVDGASPSDPAVNAVRARVDAVIRTFGVPLSPADMETIDRFHRTFITNGVSLKFETIGRAPQPYYPSYRDLLLETDREGHRWSFLTSEDDYQVVRSLEQRDLVIPVVGNLAGPSAIKAIGKLMASRGDTLSAFYTSNVEFYLFNDGTFPKFVDNLSGLPHTGRSVIIRSVFANGVAPVRFAPGYRSASLVGSVDQLVRGYVNGRFRYYSELTAVR